MYFMFELKVTLYFKSDTTHEKSIGLIEFEQ